VYLERYSITVCVFGTRDSNEVPKLPEVGRGNRERQRGFVCARAITPVHLSPADDMVRGEEEEEKEKVDAVEEDEGQGRGTRVCEGAGEGCIQKGEGADIQKGVQKVRWRWRSSFDCLHNTQLTRVRTALRALLECCCYPHIFICGHCLFKEYELYPNYGFPINKERKTMNHVNSN
jgi:hypothetical protein